jgi:hypothetical protein
MWLLFNCGCVVGILVGGVKLVGGGGWRRGCMVLWWGMYLVLGFCF